MTWEFLIFIVRMFAASKLSFWNSFSHSQSVHSSKLKRLFHPYRLLRTPNALFMLCSALLMPSRNTLEFKRIPSNGSRILLIFLLHFSPFINVLQSFSGRMMCEASMGQFETHSVGYTELMGMIWMKHIINSTNIQNNFRLLSWKIIVGIRKHFSLHITTLIRWERWWKLSSRAHQRWW